MEDESRCPGGLVEGRLRDTAMCGGRLSWFHVRSLGPASQASGAGPAISILQRQNISDYSALQASRGGTAIRRLRRPSRPPISPASAGEQGRSLPPPAPPASLSLFRSRGGLGRPGQWRDDRAKGLHSNSKPRQPVRRCLTKEDCPRRDRGHLRPPICPATFRKLPSRPSRSAQRSIEGHGQR